MIEFINFMFTDLTSFVKVIIVYTMMCYLVSRVKPVTITINGRCKKRKKKPKKTIKDVINETEDVYGKEIKKIVDDVNSYDKLL